MAIFKCKMCGGNVIPGADGFTGICEYCGTQQSMPKDKDEKISQILNRANDFRLGCDYDRAIFEYEKVLELDETEPEAHWGIFLSRYGVEYVKDTMTLAYKPTLHRISSVSVYDDVDYQATIKYASLAAAIQYKADAEHIELVMKELLLLSANQEPYDIFLSYKEIDDVTRQRTDDSYLAHDLYNELTAQGYKVFFAPKSLIGVALYEPKIYSAIISSKVMIVLGTKPEYLEGVWVKNEWSRFAEAIENGEDKVIIPVFKNMEANQLPSRIAKYQAYNMASMTFLSSLFDAVAKSVSRNSKIDFNKNASAEDAFIERGFLALEDREFKNAEAFFEDALNLNPHNSQAYFGKLMIEMKINKKEQILTSSKPLKEYKHFEKAVRFADHQLKTVLLQYEEKVQNTLDEKVYNKAMAFINKANPTSEDYSEAAKILNSISKFKDSKEKAKEFMEKSAALEKDEILEKAKTLDGELSKCSLRDYNEAVSLYKRISGWKDSNERLVKCEQKLEKKLADEKEKAEQARIIAEEARKEKERKLQEELKKQEKLQKKRKRIIRAVIVLFCLFIVGASLYIGLYDSVIYPSGLYREAVEELENGDIFRAKRIFEQLGSFRDSKQKLYEIEQADAYQRLVENVEKGYLESARENLEDLHDYKDSEQYRIYVNALVDENGNNKDIFDVEDELRTLPSDFLNVGEILAFIDNNRAYGNKRYYYAADDDYIELEFALWFNDGNWHIWFENYNYSILELDSIVGGKCINGNSSSDAYGEISEETLTVYNYYPEDIRVYYSVD